MNRDWQVSLVTAVSCHVAVLFAVQPDAGTPGRSNSPSQIEVTLVAAPSEAVQAALVAPVIERPKPDPPSELPPEPKPVVKEPEPVPIKPDELVSPKPIELPKPVEEPKPVSAVAPPPRLAVTTTPVPTPLSAPVVGDGSSPSRGRDTTTVQSEPDIRARPAYRKNPEPPYPAKARRRGQTGIVLLHVTVTAGGRAGRVTLKETSGVAALDEAALQAVRAWEFEPARIGSTDVESEIEVPVRFKLTN